MTRISAVDVGKFLQESNIVVGNSGDTAKFDDLCFNGLYDKSWLGIGLTRIDFVGEYVTAPGPSGAESEWKNVEKERTHVAALLDFDTNPITMKVKDKDSKEEVAKVASMITSRFGCRITLRLV